MKQFKYVFLVLLVCIMTLTACKTNYRFVGTDVKLGMTKDEVIRKFGKPYKITMGRIVLEDGKTVDVETLFYREKEKYVFNFPSYFFVVLVFEDGLLVRMDQTEPSDLEPTVYFNPPVVLE